MKTILCYGDSNTWGTDAANTGRHARWVRWPGVLQQALGSDDYHVIEEGLSGRTTVWDDPIEGVYLNGLTYLMPCLGSHRPIDLVVLMLGSNDMKQRFGLPAADIARGASVLVRTILSTRTGPDDGTPQVLLIAPPGVDQMPSDLHEMFGDAATKAARFPALYRAVAEEHGCLFLDSQELVTPSPHDGLHLDAPEHRKLGEAVATVVRGLFETS